MKIDADILMPFWLIAVPLFVMAAVARGAVRSINRSVYDDSRGTSLVYFSAVVGLVGAVWTVGGIVAAALGALSQAEGFVISFCGVASVVGVCGIVTARLISQCNDIMQADELQEVPGIDREIDQLTGNLRGTMGVLAFLGLCATCSQSIPVLVGQLVACAIIIPFVSNHFRQRRESELLWLLTLSVRNHSDLATEIESFAKQHTGMYAARLKWLVSDLRNGKSLGESIRRTTERNWLTDTLRLLGVAGRSLMGRATADVHSGRGAISMPGWIVTAIQHGEATNSLAHELERTAAQYLQSLRSSRNMTNAHQIISYGIIGLLIVPSLVWYIAIYIVPKYKFIIDEFELETPEVTRKVIAFAEIVEQYDFIWGPLALLVVFAFFGYGLNRRNGWRDIQASWLRRLMTKWDAPDILRRIAHAMRQGSTMVESLTVLSRTHQRFVIRSALTEIRQDVENGADCWKSLCEHGFLTDPDVQLIRAAERAHNLAWALEELAATRERRMAYRLQLWFQWIQPAVVVGLGVLVGFVAIGMFLPLVKLIGGLS